MWGQMAPATWRSSPSFQATSFVAEAVDRHHCPFGHLVDAGDGEPAEGHGVGEVLGHGAVLLVSGGMSGWWGSRPATSARHVIAYCLQS